MRSRASNLPVRWLSVMLTAVLVAALAADAESKQQAGRFAYHILGDEPGAWPQILSSVGFVPAQGGKASILVVRPGAGFDPEKLLEEVSRGAVLVLEGDGEFARSLGFEPTEVRLRVGSVEDVNRPELRIVWAQQLEMPRYRVPSSAIVFSRERWEKAPLVAGIRRGKGGILWLAAPPGNSGYDRFPYLLQAIARLGAPPQLRSNYLWAFLDSSYRLRVDLDYFARKWREAGISGLHVAAWHFYDADAERDVWLRRLIEACHRNGILVHAWLELPHVSEKFWEAHPEWREKTAAGQDAHLDWRKLMNLANRECFAAVAGGVEALVDRFDWDGVNLAELYFESLEGHENSARFTPMNEDVRAEFRRRAGFDPSQLFDPSSTRHYSRNPAGLRRFLDYRAALAHRMQEQMLETLERIRRRKPHLELTLTHVDDRLDATMREKLGSDARSALSLLDRFDFTFLIEDPATAWHLGPERYTELAARYAGLTPRQDRLAIDVNIVERFQDVYPTKQQTGIELFRLVKLSAQAFPRVALYFEASLLPPDLPLLSAAAANVRRLEELGDRVRVESQAGAGLLWQGPATVNGVLWPAADADTLWLPSGTAVVAPAQQAVPLRLLRLSAPLRTARCLPGGIEFSYDSRARVLAIVNFRPARVEVDGAEQAAPVESGEPGEFLLRLPRGQHIISLFAN